MSHYLSTSCFCQAYICWTCWDTAGAAHVWNVKMSSILSHLSTEWSAISFKRSAEGYVKICWLTKSTNYLHKTDIYLSFLCFIDRQTDRLTDCLCGSNTEITHIKLFQLQLMDYTTSSTHGQLTCGNVEERDQNLKAGSRLFVISVPLVSPESTAKMKTVSWILPHLPLVTQIFVKGLASFFNKSNIVNAVTLKTTSI